MGLVAGGEKLRATGGCHAWQLLMLTPARPCRSFQSCALPCQLAHNKCHCSAQVESNLLTLFLCGQLFLSCVLLLLLLLVTCCLLLLVLRTLGAASPSRSLELTEPPPGVAAPAGALQRPRSGYQSGSWLNAHRI